MNGMHSHLKVTICQDAEEAIAKGYNYAAKGDVKPLRINEVVVVRDGTMEHRPTVDFVLEAEDGKKFVFAVTGALLKSIPC